MLLLAVVLTTRVVVIRRGNGAQIGRTTSEVDVDSTSVVLSSILQTHFTADLFNSGLDFLDVVGRVITFTDDTVFPRTSLSVTMSFRAGQNKTSNKKHTHEDGSGHVPWRT